MTISVGDPLPSSTMLEMDENGAQEVSLSSLTDGKKVVIFGLPGAYTSTCTAAHVPSFIRTADALRAKGVDHIICFAVNDPFIMQSWGKSTGGSEAGIRFLADADGSFTKSLGLNFDAPPVGFYGRTLRHAMVVENGVVVTLNIEQERGACALSAGETILETLG